MVNAEVNYKINEPTVRGEWNDGASRCRWLDMALATGMACLFVVATLIWSLFDYRFPTQDEAAHIMNSINFKEMLVHCRLWHY